MFSHVVRRAEPAVLWPRTIRWLLSLAFAANAVPALAVPISHTVLPDASAITGTFSLNASASVNTNLGSFTSATVNLGGTFVDLSSSPNGGIDVDWGSPSWSDSLEMEFAVEAFNIAATSGGTSISIDVPVIGDVVSYPVTFGLQVDSLQLATFDSFLGASVPDEGGFPGAGPWTASDDPIVGFLARYSLLIGSAAGIVTRPLEFPLEVAVPVDLELRREEGNPGIGSRAVIDFGGVSSPVPAEYNFNFPGAGCIVDTLLGCALNVSGYSVRVTNVGLSNVGAHLEATQTGTIPVPEPGTALLAALGIALLAAGARARRSRQSLVNGGASRRAHLGAGGFG